MARVETSIQVLRGTIDAWNKYTKVPLDGQPLLVEFTDGSRRLKFGDGTNTFANLPYIDVAQNTYVKKTGDTINGNLTIDSGSLIVNLDPGIKDAFKITDRIYTSGTTALCSLVYDHGNLTLEGGSFIGDLTGTAESASLAYKSTKLSTARTIFGQSFDGTANVAGKGVFYGDTSNLALTTKYKQNALEIRENGTVGSNQSNELYAPGIGFHWLNIAAGSLILNRSGEFEFKTQAWNRGKVNANLYGLLLSNSEFHYQGEGGLTYYDANINNLNSASNIWSAPTKNWHQIIHMALSVSNYYNELAFPVNDIEGLAWRQRRNDSYYGWYRILDSNNFKLYVTPSAIGLGNVENKSSATIRGELTKKNVVDALGYTPGTSNQNYTHPTTPGYKHIPSGGSSGQILRWSADGTAVWGNDKNDNTWRPVVDNLTSTDTDKSLSAKQGKVLKNSLDNHSHGLLHSNLTTSLPDTTTDSGWAMINSNYAGFLLKSIRTGANTPNWIIGNFSSGIVFGGSDTHGILSIEYSTPHIKFAGGNGTKPVWYFDIKGTSGKTYNLDNLSSGSNSTTYTNKISKLETKLEAIAVDNLYLNPSNVSIGALKTDMLTNTYLEGNKGRAIINSTKSGYVMLYRMKSSNGVFTGGVFNTRYELHYTTDSNIKAGNNSATYSAVLLDESGNTSLPGSLTVSGNITGAKVYNAVWNADYAEAFDYQGNIPKVGTIVELCGDKKVRTARDTSRKVIGVASDSYWVLAGSDLEEVKNGSKVAVGLVGQVKVLMNSTVEYGDFIVSGMNGIGKVDNDAPRGSIIGRAMESNNEKGEKLVTCIIQPQ